MHFEGVERFAAAADVVAQLLTDAGRVATLVPDATVTAGGPDRAEWTARPNLPIAPGGVSSVAEAVARDGPTGVRYRVVSRSAGASAVVTVAIRVKPTPDGQAEVVWAVDVGEMSGLLRLMPSGAVRTVVERTIPRVWAEVRARVEAR